MLPLFTQLLKDFLVRQNVAPDGGGATPAGRIVLGPPDRAFATGVAQGQTANVYLADIRENRRLRTNERFRESPGTGPGQLAVETMYPAWVDAHYLITAWDTAADQSTRALKEHEVLANVSAALLAGDPFTPREVYPDPTDAQLASVAPARDAARAAALQAGRTQAQAAAAGDAAADQERQRIIDIVLAALLVWPRHFWLPGLPYQVLPPEGFPKLSEFWTTMGTGSVWKPLVYLVASVPVALQPRLEFPMVTSMTTTIGQTGNAQARRLTPGTDREWYQIGGFVSRLEGPLKLPVRGAKVVLQLSGDPAAAPVVDPIPLQETRADDEGMYQFLFAGPLRTTDPDGRQRAYQVVVRSSGLRDAEMTVKFDPLTPVPHDVVMRRL